MGDEGSTAHAPAPRAPQPAVSSNEGKAPLASAARPKKMDTFDGKEPASPVGIRYGTAKMAEIFGWRNYIQALLDVEAAVAQSISELHPDKVTPAQAARIREVANVETVLPSEVDRVEREVTHHDIIALQRVLAEKAGKEAGRAVHFTLTSADVTETAKAIQVKQALTVLIESVEDLRDTLLKFAVQHRKVVAIGRTHGQHAIPISFGYPFANYAYDLQKHVNRLNWDLRNCVEGKISGALGTYDTAADEGMTGRKIARTTLSLLGIKQAEISLQVPSRENTTHIISDIASLGKRVATIGDFIKFLKTTGIDEVLEKPDEGTEGSSAMPIKSIKGNPHVEERNAGFSAVLDGFATTELEVQAMKDGRDLVASAPDRIILGSAFHLIDHQVRLLENIVRRIELVPENIERNLMLQQGAETTPRVMSRLITKGVSRNDARDICKAAGRTVIAEHRPFETVLLEMRMGNPSLALLSAEEIHELTKMHDYIGESRNLVIDIARRYRGKRSSNPKKGSLEDAVRA